MTWNSTKLTEDQLPYVSQTTVKTVEECFDIFVRPTLPAVDVVQHWHRLLLDYVAQPSAIVFIRRYASAKKTEYHRLRRGFLTLDPSGFGFAFCDNYLPQLVFAKVLAGIKPTLSELNEAIENREFPVSVRVTTPEKEQLTFGRTTAPPLGKRGWKLSHLHSVNQGYNFNYRETSAQIFPRGEYAWWGSTDRVHRLAEPISPESRRIMIAHFLRAVHPANYFLSPASSWQASGKDVGENHALLAYVQRNFRERYGSMVAELEPLLLLEGYGYGQVIATTELAVTVRRPLKGDNVAATTAKITSSASPSRKAAKPYPITYSIGNDVEIGKDEFLQALLRTKRASITRHFRDGRDIAITKWDASGMTATSSLTSNIRGRIRPAAERENIARVHVTVLLGG